MLVVAGTIIGGLVAGGVAYATIPSDNVIDGCYSRSGGTLRVIDSTVTECKKGETALAWNVQGVQGDQGIQGVQGATGPAGPAGPAGAAGTSDAYTVFTILEPASVSVPAGNYVVVGHGLVQNTDTDPHEALCSLQGVPVSFADLGPKTDFAFFTTLPITGTVSLASPGTITIDCEGTTPAIVAAELKLTVIKVTSIN
jgi:hypothetical protein